MSRVAVCLAVVLSLAVTVPAVAVAPKRGAYRGQTSQSLSLKMKVGRKAVRSFDFGWFAECPKGDDLERDADGWTNLAIKRKGRTRTFSLSESYDMKLSNGRSATVATDIKGRFVSRKKAKGALRVSAAVFNPQGVETDLCDSGHVTWSARHR